MKGFLFFEGNEQLPPSLLLECINQLSLNTDQSVVVTNARYIDSLRPLFPSIIFLDTLLFPTSQAEADYIASIHSNLIRSNHPPSELLCLRRWQVLFSLFDELVFKPDDLVICIDWDTFLFKPINKLIQYLNDKHDPALPFLACFFRNGLRDSVLAGNIPIFEICPNLLFINKRSIDIYASLVSHILINQDNLKRIFINRFFNDMSIFSVLVSWLFVHFSCDCVFDLDLISDEVEIFTDHNLRVQWQGRHYFLTNKYTIPSYIDYTNSGFVELKWFKVIGGIPYVQTNKGDYICCSCLHFSSIEAKYLLANGHTSYKMSAKSDNLISSL